MSKNIFLAAAIWLLLEPLSGHMKTLEWLVDSSVVSLIRYLDLIIW